MKYRAITGLLIVLMVCSCMQKKSKEGQDVQTSSNPLPDSNTGLLIENGPPRGTGFTDSLGLEYNIVHITTTITNDSSIPTRLQIDLPEDFSHPIFGGHQKFKIIVWPGLAEPPHLYTESPERVLENFSGNGSEKPNQFNRLLAPGEKFIMSIGTIFSRPAEFCSVVAYSLLEYGDRQKYQDCVWTMEEEHLTNRQFALGLHVGFCTSGQNYKSCMIITCGKTTYIGD